MAAMDKAMTPRLGFSLKAYNTATKSRNRMHDDTVARSYGFDGGLVPGVVLLAYMAHPPVTKWGLDWLSEGSISARFSMPVYHGDRVTISASSDQEASDDEMVLALADSNGELKVSGLASARSQATPHQIDMEAAPELPKTLPIASPNSLSTGTTLAPWAEQFHGAQSVDYLETIGAPASVFTRERVAQPGWFAELANSLLSSNVALGPWIHVSSDITMYGLVHDEQLILTCGRVRDEYERRGHRFVVVDCALTEGSRRVADVVHTAIYSPHQETPT